MNKRRLTTVSITLILLFAGMYCLPARGERPIVNVQNRTISLFGFLDELGRQNDLFFTIEEGWTDGEARNWLDQCTVDKPAQKGGPREGLERLSRTVPYFTYMVNKANPRIIHIVDSRLKQQRDYGLEYTISSIDFVGTAPRLVNEIRLQGIPVSANRNLSTTDPGLYDFSTEVRVKGKQQGVRDALSNFIPLEGRGHVLWISRTKLGRGEMSYVQFYGPAKKS